MADPRRKPKPRGRGRPPLGALARSVTRTIKLSPAEDAAIVTAAEGEGQPVSEWLRAAAELALARGSTR